MTVTFLSKTPPTNKNDFLLISATIPFTFFHRYPLKKATYNSCTSTYVGLGKITIRKSKFQ
ncbi:hypothetical protein B0186_01680 [Canicola haemoglobinophilus]|nr:hypothetical protein B0186_01680 [Canicola haemoglobinophilus]